MINFSKVNLVLARARAMTPLKITKILLKYVFVAAKFNAFLTKIWGAWPNTPSPKYAPESAFILNNFATNFARGELIGELELITKLI